MEKNQNENLEAALKYLSLSFSVIPVGRDKKPLIEWKQYQIFHASEEQIRKWWTQFPNANVGVVTGAISGVVVIDVEKGGKTKDLPPTVISRTGGDGFHFFYKYPNRPVPNATRIRELTDIRGDGGYVVMPPSIHASGVKYEWMVDPETSDFADFPEELFKNIVTQNEWRAVKPSWSTVASGVSEGIRNVSAATLAGKLFSEIKPELWELAVWPTMKNWNTRNTPPMPEKELHTVFKSIASREMNRHLTERQPDGYNEDKKIQLLTLGDLLDKEFPPQMWRVEQILPVRGLGIISGVAGIGKSWFVAELARCVALGKPFFDKYPVTAGKILIIDEDMGEQELNRRWKMLPDNDKIRSQVFFLSLTNFALDDEEGMIQLENIIQENGIGLLILDPLVGMHTRDENVAIEMRKFFKRFNNLKNKGVTVLFVHHNRKQNPYTKKNLLESMRGSSDIPAAVETHLVVEEQDGYMVLTQTKNRNARRIDPFRIRLIEEGGIMRLSYEGEYDPHKKKKEEAKGLIVETLKDAPEPITIMELREALKESDVGKTNIEIALLEMRREGVIEASPIKGRGNKLFYSLVTEITEGKDKWDGFD